MEEGVEGTALGDSGVGSPCQELQESSVNPNEAGGALAGTWMSGWRGCEIPLGAPGAPGVTPQ